MAFSTALFLRVKGVLVADQRPDLVGLIVEGARHDLRVGKAAGLFLAEGVALQDLLLIHPVQRLDQEGLAADTAADGDLFEIQQDAQI